MRPSSIIVGLIIFSGFIGGFAVFYNDLQNNYGVTGTDLEDYNYNDELNESASGMGGSVKTGTTVTTTDNPYIDGIITTFKTLIDFPDQVSNIYSEVGEEAELPIWFGSMLLSIVVALMGFGIAGAIWKWYL